MRTRFGGSPGRRSAIGDGAHRDGGRVRGWRSALAWLVLATAVALGAPKVFGQTVTTVAGVGQGDGGPATGATLVLVRGLALDAAGNLHVVDNNMWRVRKVDRVTGVISAFAGVGTILANGASGDGGAAASASLNQPFEMVFDAGGNAYITDRFNHRIRRVDAATGIITTHAGTGVAGFSGDGGPATSARFNAPSGLAIDAAGNLFIGDSFNHRVRRIDAATGTITTIAGNGTAGFSGDGGPATAASFNATNRVVLDANGNLYIVDFNNHRIRKLTVATGNVDTIAGNGTTAFAGDGGPATAAAFNNIYGLGIDPQGNLFVADRFNHRIRRIDAATGTITTVSGNGIGGYSGDGGPASGAQMLQPGSVLVDAAGNLYFSDMFNHRIRRIDAISGIVTTVAGAGVNDGRVATATALLNPFGLSKDTAGHLVLTDAFNSRVRRVDSATAVVTTLAGQGELTFTGDGGLATAARLNGPVAARYDAAGDLFILDYRNNRIRRVSAATGIISTFAGNGTAAFAGDGGPASAAAFNNPNDLILDSLGNYIVSDTLNHRIRKIDRTTLVVTTIAGTGTPGFGGDGGDATAAALNEPASLAYDAQGNLLVADYRNHRVRRISAATGVITTIAGNGTPAFAGDGGPAVNASLNGPSGLAVDSGGNIYMGDLFNGRIRRIDAATGSIVTVFGNGNRLYSGNGIAPLLAGGEPQNLMLDGDATLYFADTRNGVVRRIDAVNTPVLIAQSIAFAALPDRAYGSAAFTVSATATSGLAVAFASLTPATCLVSGTTVTPVAAGTCTLAASQPGNTIYAPAPTVNQSFRVTGLFRAYLSRSGSDANPCTLQQPCRLLPAALAVANPGGEVWMLDSANFNAGAVTIAKSVTILAVPGALGSIVANNADALVVQGDANAEVTLRNLVVLNLAGSSGIGVWLLQGAQLTVEGCEIYGMSVGIRAESPASLVTLKDSVVRDMQAAGIEMAGTSLLVADRVEVLNSPIGVLVQDGAQAQLRDSVVSGNVLGVRLQSTAQGQVPRVSILDTTLSANGAGLDVASFQPTHAVQALIDGSLFSANGIGVQAFGAGAVNLFTRQNNTFRFNTTDVSAATLVPQAAQ